MPSLTTLALGLLSLTLFVPEASASYLVGNGGGGWVCRDADDGELRWIQLVDVFEAQAQFPINAWEGLSDTEILKALGRRMEAISPWLGTAFRIRLERVREQWVPVSNMQLEVIDDALYYGRPAPETCLMGSLTYEQIVNFFPDGRIFADSRLFDVLAPLDKAALFAHEALYLLFRETLGDTNSLRARKAVSLLLSQKTPRELRTAFDWLPSSSHVSVASPAFDELGILAEGLVPAKLDGRWGYLSTTTRWKISNQFEAAHPFRERRAAVRKGGLWGFVDHAGRFVVKPGFLDAGDFAQGLAPVRGRDGWSYVNATGQPAFAPQFSFLTEFSKEGLGIAATRDDVDAHRLRIIDGQGNTVTALPGTEARAFHEGFAAIRNGDWRYVDKTGARIAGGFSTAGDFINGRAVVTLPDGNQNLIDPQGRLLLESGWKEIFIDKGDDLVACDGLAPQVQCWHLLPSGQQWPFPPGDQLLSAFVDGYAIFRRGSRQGLVAKVAVP